MDKYLSTISHARYIQHRQQLKKWISVKALLVHPDLHVQNLFHHWSLTRDEGSVLNLRDRRINQFDLQNINHSTPTLVTLEAIHGSILCLLCIASHLLALSLPLVFLFFTIHSVDNGILLANYSDKDVSCPFSYCH